MTQNVHDEERRRGFLSELIANFQLALRLMADRQVPLGTKLLLPLLTLGYFALPIDLLPDVVPFLGQFDDLIALVLLTRLFIALAPADVVAAHRAQMGLGGKRAGQSHADSSAQGRTGGAYAEDVVDADFRVVRDG